VSRREKNWRDLRAYSVWSVYLYPPDAKGAICWVGAITHLRGRGRGLINCPRIFMEGLRKTTKTFSKDVGFGVLTAVVMKNSIFWGTCITPCITLKVSRRFGGTCCLHLHGRWVFQVRNQREAGSKQSVKLGKTCSSEISVDFQRTTRSYIPEDRTLLQ
jgi:hypothetical protein